MHLAQQYLVVSGFCIRNVLLLASAEMTGDLFCYAERYSRRAQVLLLLMLNSLKLRPSGSKSS